MGDSSTSFKDMQLMLIDGKTQSECCVCVTDEGVSWELDSATSGAITTKNTIAIQRLLIAIVTESKTCTQDDESTVAIHYVSTKPGNKEVITRGMQLTFGGSRDKCTKCSEKINDLLKQETSRPKRILLFVNTWSGSGAGDKVYHKKVAPILDLMGVAVELVYTRPGFDQTNEILASYDLTSIDVIAVMGGDGTLGTICFALLKRTQTDAGVDMNDPEAKLVTPSVPLAVIPVGTGNGQAVCFNCTKDVESSIYTMLLGYRHTKDITTFYTNGSLQGISMIILGFGMMGMIREYIESKRWMGMMRYLLFLPCFLKKRDPFDVEIEYLSKDSLGNSLWQKFSGLANSVNVLPIIYPSGEAASGVLKLSWVKPCTMNERFTYIKRLMEGDITMNGLDFVGHADVSCFKISTSVDNRRTRVIEWDGEVLELPAPNLEARLHQGLVEIVGLDPQLVPSDILQKFRAEAKC